MNASLTECAWPIARAGEAFAALARACNLSAARSAATSAASAASTTALHADFPLDNPRAQARWLTTLGATLGVEVEEVESPYRDLERAIGMAAPALVRTRIGETWWLFAVIAGSRRMVSLLTPDSIIRRFRPRALRAAICGSLETAAADEIDRLLDDLQLSSSRRARMHAALRDERLASKRITSIWLLRPPPEAPFAAQAGRLWSRVGALVLARTAVYALWIVSWWILGRATLEGHLDRDWLIAWALLLASVIPLDLLATWLQGHLSIHLGALLKERLLHGALRLEPGEIRHEGAGQLLGRVIEAQAIEALALSGGFLGVMAAIELALAALVLTQATVWATWAVIGCTAVAIALTWWIVRRRRGWTEDRLAMTNDLVEQMMGHRTRLAQEAREQWHEAEDRALTQYLDTSRAMDRGMLALLSLPRAWLIVGVMATGALFVPGAVPATTLAIALGGTLLAYRAFRRFTAGASHIAGAAIAWRSVAPLFRAASRQTRPGSATFTATPPSPDAAADREVLLAAHDLSFVHANRATPIVNRCNVEVRHGERLLLDSPSGSGKSTLASLLCGLRQPTSGLLLLDGVDLRTMGDAEWRRRVVTVPQFHENHIFTNTLAFNLLMGSRWPPEPEDLVQAHTLCGELGLGELLDRMPAGLLQQIGETGWQLSHGERSRVFIARALLQGSDLLVLDESFGQLDPENLDRVLQCVLRRAPTILLITHT